MIRDSAWLLMSRRVGVYDFLAAAIVYIGLIVCACGQRWVSFICERNNMVN
jgi:hypothetical protein